MTSKTGLKKNKRNKISKDKIKRKNKLRNDKKKKSNYKNED